MEERNLTWREARLVLRTGDLLLYKPDSLEGRAIVRETGGTSSHAAMVAVVQLADDLHAHKHFLQCETVQHHAARLICLHGQVKAYPGLIRVYRVNRELSPDFRPDMAFAFFRKASGFGYSWLFIWAVFFRRLFGRWFPVPKNTCNPEYPRDCSGLYHAAMRCWADGPVDEEFDADCTPTTLEQSRGYTYLCTLVT